MQGGSITKCLDKQVSAMLCHLFHQSHTLRNKSPIIKRRSPLLTFQNHFTNILNSILVKQILWDPCAEIKQFLQENVSGKNVAIATFMNIFHINRNAAKFIVSENNVFTELPKKTITDNYEKLKYAGMSLPLLQDNILLLAEDSNVLQKKIDIVQRFTNDINDGVPFLYHNAINLSLFIKSNTVEIGYDSIKDQIKYFEEQLQVKHKELYSILSKYLFYLTNHPETTIQKIKLLLDYEVSVNSLIEDNWPMHCTYEKMKTRLEKCLEVGLLLPPRPWILNCNETVFYRRMKTSDVSKTKFNQFSLLIDFLSTKSGYNKKVIEYKISSISQSQLPNLNQAKQKINIILKQGYEYHDIIWSIKVLSLDEDLINSRFSILQTVKHKAPFLNVLLLSNEGFVNYVNSNNSK